MKHLIRGKCDKSTNIEMIINLLLTHLKSQDPSFGNQNCPSNVQLSMTVKLQFNKIILMLDRASKLCLPNPLYDGRYFFFCILHLPIRASA